MTSPFLRLFAKRAASLIAVTLLFAAGGAMAQYPNKSIKLIVPYPPGGATDVIGRVLAQRLSTALGQQVIIDNRGGAGGNIGAEAVAKSAPDGYTLLMGALTSHSIMATLEKGTLRYDLARDLVPVAVVGSVPLVWVVYPPLPVNSLKELVAYAKANPGKLTYASSGAGAPQRMCAELFRLKIGADMIHVPYKGSGPAMGDLVGGQVVTMCETVPASLQLIKAGKLRALAVTTAQRISQLPDVPTAAEAGTPGIEVSSLFGVMAPAGTPAPIIARLNAELQKILATPEAQEQLLQQGAYAVQMSPEQSAARIRQEIDLWARVIQEAKIKSD
ncbi:MAG TPA: tripartite tricarboxylate transporter substrate binding protein [Usitatibacteraceae bacterium]|nr:tripartite tricarboxylate transporter substrate binding protein [Usitatibacteraceae bacterium]